MARALFGLLVVAALGVTGYYTYNYVHNEGTCCHSDGAATVKRSCCTSETTKSCCSESGDCTSACGLGEGKSEEKKSCCEGKEGSCCQEKKAEEKKEEKKDDGKKE